MTDLRAMVRPLEWRESWTERWNGEELPTWEAVTLGTYFKFTSAGLPNKAHADADAEWLAARKASYQEVYEQRILAALDHAAFERAVAEAVERERERCARICEGEVVDLHYIHWPAFHMPDACSGKEGDLALLAWAFAAAIRKGDTP